MKIVKILGGLGNQMFQYAFYLALKELHPDEEILMDASFFRGYGLHNGLELDKIFGIVINQARFSQLIKVTLPVYNYKLGVLLRHVLGVRKKHYLEPKNHKLDLGLLERNDDLYLEGYWQNCKYFDNVKTKLAEVFRIQVPDDEHNKRALKLIDNCNSVAIHIRRGDYVNHPQFKGICDYDYYRKAVSYMLEKIDDPVFFIFSNDITWCKNNIEPLMQGGRVEYIDFNVGHNSYFDILLMQHCKYMVLANSSFSWWAAYLNCNDDAVIVSPGKWGNFISNEDSPIIDKWIKL